MCRSHDQGHRRCKGSVFTKANESLRKAINYQASKAGMTAEEWKEKNPDLLEAIKDTYQKRLDKFSDKLSDKLKDQTGTNTPAKPLTKLQQAFADIKAGTYVPPDQSKKVEPIGYIDENGEALATGVQTPAEAAKQNPIHGFASKGDLRKNNSEFDHLEDYINASEKYAEKLNLTKDEKHSVLCYSNDMYRPLNKYFLKKDLNDGIFSDNFGSWKDSENGWQMYFSNEKDLLSLASNLDSALSHRAEEPRIVYRGINVREDSASIKAMNNGVGCWDTDARKKLLENYYTPGTEISFDAYSSASDRVSVAANWCNSHEDWSDDPGTGLMFEIKTSAGVPIAHLSGHSDEREILMPRGMRLKVANVYWNSDDDEDCYQYDNLYSKTVAKAKNPNTLIVQLIEIDEHGNEISDHATKYNAPDLVVRSEVEGDKKNV